MQTVSCNFKSTKFNHQCLEKRVQSFFPTFFLKSAKKDPKKTKSRPVVVFIAVLSYNFSNILKMFWHFWKILKLTNLFPRISFSYDFYSPLLPWRLSWRIYTPVMSLVHQLSPSKRNQSADFLQNLLTKLIKFWVDLVLNTLRVPIKFTCKSFK